MDLLKEMEDNFPFRKETYKIIGCAMKVHSELGNGFLEAVYQEAFSVILRKENIPFEQEKVLEIFFMGEKLNKKYIADFICYKEIIVETKAVKELNNNHYAQVLNYLKATNKKIGLLINFGSESLEYKRIIK
jgi:GxxExxY protein